jgi:hypothetical protein
MRLQLPALALLLLTSSTAWADLKTYDVDPQYRQEIYSALLKILDPAGEGFNGKTEGRVQLLPSGQILVNAPAGTLTQVEQVLQAIRNRPAPAAPRVELHYWAVLGSRGATNPPGTPPPSALNPVLAEMKRFHGDLTFRVIGSAALTTESGQPGNVSGMALEIAQTAFAQGDNLNATIGVNLEGIGGSEGPNARFAIGSIRVQTALKRGEFVVLGQSELKSGLDGPVFFIVHWPAN